MLSLLLTLFTTAFRFSDAVTLRADDATPSPQHTIPITETDRTYKLREVVASSATPFCLSISEVADPSRVLQDGCYPAGNYTFEFRFGESELTGKPGRNYTITAVRAHGYPTGSTALVLIRVAVEVLPVPPPPVSIATPTTPPVTPAGPAPSTPAAPVKPTPKS